MKVEVHKSPAGILWWRTEEGIWHLKPSAKYVATAEDAETLLSAMESFRKGAKAPLLIDRTNSYSPSFAALQVLWPRLGTLISALAYYAPTQPARIASDTVIQVVGGDAVGNVAIFQNEAEAVRWLMTFASS